jgi:hypothetical protein
MTVSGNRILGVGIEKVCLVSMEELETERER